LDEEEEPDACHQAVEDQESLFPRYFFDDQIYISEFGLRLAKLNDSRGIIARPIVEVGSCFANAKADDRHQIFSLTNNILQIFNHRNRHLLLLFSLLVFEILGYILIVLHRPVHLGDELQTAQALLDLLFIVKVVGSLHHENHREHQSDRHGD
jgi:hypothetical protein